MVATPSPVRQAVKRHKEDSKNVKAAHKKMLSKSTPEQKKKSSEMAKKYPAGYMSPAAKARESKRPAKFRD